MKIAAALAGCLLFAAHARAQPVIRLPAFLDSLRINIHGQEAGVAYTDTATIIAALRQTGLHHVRLNDYAANLPAMRQLCAAGIGLLLLHDTNNGSIADEQALGRPCIDGLSGANEINNDTQPSRFFYHGVSGLLAVIAMQTDLFNAAQVWDQTVPVLTPSNSVGAPSKGAGKFDNIATHGDVHSYVDQGGPPFYGALPQTIAQAGLLAPEKPFWMSESGYTTCVDPADSGCVSQEIQAVRTLQIYLDAARRGVLATYVYELFDECRDLINGECSYGLYALAADGTLHAKAAAHALAAATRILTTNHGVSVGTPAKPLAVSWQGLPYNTSVLEIIGTAGDVWFAVWQEQPQTTVIVPSSDTLVLPSSAAITVYDPIAGSAPVHRVNASSVVFSQGLHPVLLHVVPGG